jgi:dolichol-phosphate mannosyltransferase
LKKIVIIPTYNEKENIAEILSVVFGLGHNFHVLVVDDGSPDGTAQIVKDLQQKYAGALHIEERKGKLGLGTAYIHGFKWCIQNAYDYVFEMDADFSHNPNDLIRLYEACAEGKADVAIGSRYVAGGKIENWSWDRHFYSRGGSLYTRILTWMPVKDPTAGFICYSRKVLEAINFDEIKFVGYAFQIEMKFVSWKLGFKIVEVPITFTDRKLGHSKMNGGIIKEGIFGVFSMQWKALSKGYKRKVRNDAGGNAYASHVKP